MAEKPSGKTRKAAKIKKLAKYDPFEMFKNKGLKIKKKQIF